MIKKTVKLFYEIWTKVSYRLILPLNLCVLISYTVSAEEPAKGVVTQSQVVDAADFIMLRTELGSVQGELIELLEKYEVLKEREVNLRSSLAANLLNVKDENSKDVLSDPKSSLVGALKLASNQSDEVIELCSMLSRVVNKSNLSNVEKMKMNLYINKVRAKAERYLQLFKLDYPKVRSCDVLSIDSNVGVVFLAAGLKNGLRVGDVLNIGNSHSLRIVVVRDFVAAALLLKGDMSAIVPGDKAVRTVTQTKK
jgi:hypothetical protein